MLDEANALSRGGSTLRGEIDRLEGQTCQTLALKAHGDGNWPVALFYAQRALGTRPALPISQDPR